MKKCLFILIIFLLIPSSFSWNWQTHQAIAESTYYNLPLNIRSNLDLNLTKQGSIAPDSTFHDNVLHHYPPSLDLTLYWINITINEYNNKNYLNSSYALGVATHYVSDSYSAPHYISKEPWNLHSLYEKQGSYSYLNVKCEKSKLDINYSLFLASKEKETWDEWILTKSPKIPQQAVAKATKLTINIALNIFNATCQNNNTTFKKYKIKINPITITLALILILILIYFIFLKTK